MLRFLNFPTQLTNLRRFNNHAKDNDPWIANDISNKKQKKKIKFPQPLPMIPFWNIFFYLAQEFLQ
jgi:hypothetical protein